MAENKMQELAMYQNMKDTKLKNTENENINNHIVTLVTRLSDYSSCS